MTTIIKVGYPTIEDVNAPDVEWCLGQVIPPCSAVDVATMHPDTFWIETNAVGKEVLCRAIVQGTCPKIETTSAIHEPRPFVIVEDFIGGRPSKPPHK